MNVDWPNFDPFVERRKHLLISYNLNVHFRFDMGMTMWKYKFGGYFRFALYIAISLTELLNHVSSQNVLGCGGFVKSEIPIDFSRVEVKLYTKQGSIRYQTDCAPNNGYYLIPVYDKGDYILKVEPPNGWSFEPTSISLHIDGSTDACSQSQDINFHFKGFSINGQIISRGSSEGPSDIYVELSLSSNPKKSLQKSVTETSGHFHFGNVKPGDYIISASHQTLQFERKSATIQVTKDNGVVLQKLVVAGYDATGRVLGDDGEAVRGVHFILFGKPDPQLAPRQCEAGLPPGYDPKYLSHYAPLAPLCHVASLEDGRFFFPLLVPGQYAVVPFYKNQNIKFDVMPSKVDVHIEHESIVLKQEFKVEGFSVNGRVLSRPGGRGLSGATVFLNGNKLTVTDDVGVFHLENMRAGSYVIRVESEKIQYEEAVVKINPNSPNLPDIVASKFKVCGSFNGDEIIRKTTCYLSFKPIAPSTGDIVTAQSDSDARFCVWLPNGEYEATVERSNDPRVVFKPSTLKFAINGVPIANMAFRQFKAKINGLVHCLENCDKLVHVTLRPVEFLDNKIEPVTSIVSGNAFAFTNVSSGKYELEVSNDAWCWKEKVIQVSVGNQDVQNIEFKQTGFLLTIMSSHTTLLQYNIKDAATASNTGDKISDNMGKKVGKNLENTGELTISKGMNYLCLQLPGQYTLNPVGCHIFSKENYAFDTSNPSVLTIEATRHILSGTVISEVRVSDVRIAVRSVEDGSQNSNGEEAILGPLMPKSRSKENDYEYLFTYWATPHKIIELQPRSDELLFYPDTKTITILDDCMQYAVEFVGKKGLFLDGRIEPPLAGVKVTVIARDGSIKPIVLETPANGKFRVGPLHGHSKYDIEAEKLGYVLSQKEFGHFSAYKLAEIIVSVMEEPEGKRPLAGVILSLSGVSDYRQNSLTQDDGRMVFSGLGPGQYFLRAMMKEFQFDPPSRMVEISEGSTVTVLLRGKRVAFSCYGSVTTLTGDPEGEIVIEAIGKGPCSDSQEEVTTESDGSFRLRGLQPNCDYEVRLKKGPEVNKHIERSTPKSHLVRVVDADVGKINLIAFRPWRAMDVSGNVVTPNEYLSSLKVRLTSESGTDQVASLSQSSFFQFLSLPMDGRSFVLAIESTLSHASYDYTVPSEMTFDANETYRHFTFVFNPRPVSGDHEAAQGSYLALPMALIIFIAITNHTRLLPLASKIMEFLTALANRTAQNREDASASAVGNGGGSSSNVNPSSLPFDLGAGVSKRKIKPRKIQ